MKFCKNLQRIVEISDPAYSPFFVNYRMLKKLIKELPSLIPEEGGLGKATTVGRSARKRADSPDSFAESSSSHAQHQQQHGDQTGETKPAAQRYLRQNAPFVIPDSKNKKKEELGKSPGEKAFFKMLHSEFRKASFFFEKAQQEFEIREERVREGFEIMKQANSIMVNEKWSTIAKSIFRLYRDLLLIETYAIMTFCSFSKILKKHDKWTGHSTRGPFMTNVVHKANFTHYPKVLAMISRCEKLYDQVSQRLLQEGKEGLYEDERLFINMINRLNNQVLGTPDGEGAAAQARKDDIRRENNIVAATPLAQKPESQAVSTLRTMLEENEARSNAAQVSEDPDSLDRKRIAILDATTKDPKRTKIS
eukprot:CAMPEP_0198138266 /NCGR_PEP_ID=MMETSP1443-20131203/1681_1 /TAXON_ID=186043 /ORGANISM="Entomoneis sp., Strain CCMP2396" /LENGTH=363 /DNA_ID=CAMNT_0043799973 /DNA_START=81 /DNA_END=1173 /DNA_ORIENTATION=-